MEQALDSAEQRRGESPKDPTDPPLLPKPSAGNMSQFTDCILELFAWAKASSAVTLAAVNPSCDCPASAHGPGTCLQGRGPVSAPPRCSQL